MPTRQEIGSYTAKGGFANEFDVLEKFENWQIDENVAQWLELMGYPVALVRDLEVEQIPSSISKKNLLAYGVPAGKIQEAKTFKKADLQLRLQLVNDNIIYVENLSLKRSKTTSGFNQIGKRPVDTYARYWCFPPDVQLWLKYFTGAITPENIEGIDLDTLRDKKHRRIYFNEMPEQIRGSLINYFKDNKVRLVSDLIRGRGALVADWLLVTEVSEETQASRWILADINQAINFFSEGEVRLSARGSLYLGRVFMQRKGGTPDPTSLQFKINPLQLFDD